MSAMMDYTTSAPGFVNSSETVLNRSNKRKTGTTQSISSKFAPLRLNPQHILMREGLLLKMDAVRRKTTRPIFIEAQAGQGKSTFAAQLIEQAGKLFCWYQVEPEDNDPVSFMSSFYVCLTSTLTGFEPGLAATMISKQELTAENVYQVFVQMLKDLDAFLIEDVYLVLDDLHLLVDSVYSRALIAFLIEEPPKHCRLIVVSRRPIADVLGRGFDDCSPSVINNETLALNRSEIAEYFNSILQIAVSTEIVNRLYHVTEGWIMGLLLVEQTLRRNSTWILSNPSLTADSLKSSEIFDYLFSEIVVDSSPAFRKMLLELSILPEVSLSLAAELGYHPDVRNALGDMVRQNNFMRFIDDREDKIGFHHLFRDCLHKIAERETTGAKRRKIMQKAGDWYLTEGRFEIALQCYLEGKLYPQADLALQKIGLFLVANSRLVTLQAALEKIHDKTIRSHPWLSFFFGIVCMNNRPPSALTYFNLARKSFVARGDEYGELFVLTQLIYYHITVDSRQAQNSPLVDRAEKLFLKNRSKLDVYFEVQAVIAVAQGFSWFKGDLVQAEKYSEEALHLSRRYGLMNFMAAARITRVYRFAFEGRWKETKQETEACIELYLSPRVSTIYKSTIAFLQVDMLEAFGDFTNFARRKSVLEQMAETNLMFKSVFGPYVILRYIDQLTAVGRFEKALSLTRTGLADAAINKVPHLHSQYLQYLALLTALSGDASEACETAQLAVKERDKIGIACFIVYNRLIAGAAYAILGKKEEGLRVLFQALEISRIIGDYAMRAGARAYLAYLHLQTGELEAALSDVNKLMQCMRRNRYVHFFGWTPQVMKKVLSVAVRHGVEVDYARKLASERLGVAITDEGAVVPLLKFSTLGRLNILVGRTVICQGQDLTQAQRHLLALLIVSPGLMLTTTQIQAALWPESDCKKARAKLDTLVSRLRFVLAGILGPLPVQDYFCMEKGMLSLKHCVCDAVDFMAKANQGFKHAHRNEFWQADNAFYAAHQLWNGEFMPGIDLEGQVSGFKSEILNCYLESAKAWGQILLDQGQLEEAVQIVEQALKFNEIDHALIQLLYELFCRQKIPAKAAQLIRTYRDSLIRAEFASDEIDTIIESVWFSNPHQNTRPR